MLNNVEISKIIIKIGEKEIPLTVAEAKGLQKLLSDTLGKENPFPVLFPVSVPFPTPCLPQPCWDIVWCGNDTDAVTFSLSG